MYLNIIYKWLFNKLTNSFPKVPISLKVHSLTASTQNSNPLLEIENLNKPSQIHTLNYFKVWSNFFFQSDPYLPIIQFVEFLLCLSFKME